MRQSFQFKLFACKRLKHLIETLNIAAMRQLWGRKVSDLGFADALLKVEWMAKKPGKALVKIDPFEPTTKRCRCCGHKRDLPLKERAFVCKDCGHIEDRDVNAAHNLLEAGRRPARIAIVKRCGRGLRAGAGSKTAVRWQPAFFTAESHAL